MRFYVLIFTIVILVPFTTVAQKGKKDLAQIPLDTISCSLNDHKYISQKKSTLTFASGFHWHQILKTAPNAYYRIMYHDDYTIKEEGVIKKGKKHGAWKAFYINGTQYIEANFDNGVKNGEVITWFDNGEIRSKEVYKKGKQHGECTYYEHGNQINQIKYYSYGVLEKVDFYKHGHLKKTVEK